MNILYLKVMKLPEFQLADRIRTKLFSTVKEAMERDGISQGEVARRIGAARPNINKLMRGRDAASIDFLLKIAESLGLDAELKVKKK
jgi:transcriptional regulator with XRE-family HTH domain